MYICNRAKIQCIRVSMLKKVYFVFHTTHKTIDAEAVLRVNAIDYLTTAIPKSIESGCTIALCMDEKSADAALDELAKSGQAPERVYDENWQLKNGPDSSTGRREIRGPATSVSRLDRISSAAVPSSCQLRRLT